MAVITATTAPQSRGDVRTRGSDLHGDRHVAGPGVRAFDRARRPFRVEPAGSHQDRRSLPQRDAVQYAGSRAGRHADRSDVELLQVLPGGRRTGTGRVRANPLRRSGHVVDRLLVRPDLYRRGDRARACWPATSAARPTGSSRGSSTSCGRSRSTCSRSHFR